MHFLEHGCLVSYLNMMVREIRNISLAFIFLLPVLANAQNLVVNGGFEEYVSCPQEMSNLAIDIKSLTTPTKGTTDYFNECGVGDMGIPKNFKGEQKPFKGKGYAGLHLYAPNDYREYIQFELSEPLQKGKLYRISLQSSLAESSVLAMQELTVLFTKEQIQADINQNLSPPRLERFNIERYSYVNLEIDGVLYDSGKWTEASVDFVAKGYEKYIVVGNFKNNKASKKIRLETDENKPVETSYYYLDEVNVTYLRDERYELNKPFVLNQLLFEFDNFDLTEEGKKDIRKIYTHLKKHPKLLLTINGHTDELGSDPYNKYLSSRRAWTVAKYLQELGLDKNRISWEGHGEDLPVVNDFSEKGRKKNRRVEFVMTSFEDDH
ncbi:OmpA-like periplasmic protein [Flagellimonas lutaonensis]|uniref:OmpA-like periplasmic protein n=2 Tax=Flagellimonas lutaonensis TaxID=516051 RepID=A0A0D5YR28_9FLAO|nr:OmpA-like periplasmic protein [Allomuricauda lutaonensis]